MPTKRKPRTPDPQRALNRARAVSTSTESEPAAPPASTPPPSPQPVAEGASGHAGTSPPSAPPVSSPPTDSDAPPTSRGVRLPFTPSGQVDADRLTDSQKARLRPAIPGLLAALGVDSSVTPTSPAALSEVEQDIIKFCAAMGIDVVNFVVGLALKARGYDQKHLHLLSWETAELDSTMPLSLRVIPRYLPLSGKYRDEGLLLAQVGKIVALKVAAVHMAQMADQQTTTAPASDAPPPPPPPTAPIPPPGTSAEPTPDAMPEVDAAP